MKRKNKILTTFLVGMFLLTSITTVSAVSEKKDITDIMPPKKMTEIEIIEIESDEDTFMTNTGERVYCGRVLIQGSGTVLSIVNVIPMITQIVTVSGKTTVTFYVDYEITTVGNIDDAEVVFTCTSHDVDFGNSFNAWGKLLDHEKGSVAVSKEVEPGDIVTFTISAGYIFPTPPFLLGDFGAGIVTVMDDDDISTSIENPKGQLFFKLLDRFPLIERILAARSVLNRWLSF